MLALVGRGSGGDIWTLVLTLVGGLVGGLVVI